MKPYYAFSTLSFRWNITYLELSHLMTKSTKCSVRPANTPISLCIRPVWSVFAVRSMGSWGHNVSSCGKRRLWSDCADAQADLSLRCPHSHFVGFVMRRLDYVLGYFAPLQILILVKYFGLDKLTSSVGFLQMAKGPAAVLGPPLAGNIWVF